jgi:hypothetical protein
VLRDEAYTGLREDIVGQSLCEHARAEFIENRCCFPFSETARPAAFRHEKGNNLRAMLPQLFDRGQNDRSTVVPGPRTPCREGTPRRGEGSVDPVAIDVGYRREHLARRRIQHLQRFDRNRGLSVDEVREAVRYARRRKRVGTTIGNRRRALYAGTVRVRKYSQWAGHALLVHFCSHASLRCVVK